MAANTETLKSAAKEAEHKAKAAGESAQAGMSEAEFERARADLSAQIDRLREDMAGITRALGDLGSAGKDAASAELRRRGELLRGEAEARYSDARSEIDQFSHEVGSFVGRQPITAIGIAAAAGYLMGLISGRK